MSKIKIGMGLDMNRWMALAGTGLVGCLLALSSCSSSDTTESLRISHQPLVTASGTVTVSADETRSGWYPNQPALSPSIVGGPTFGRLFKTALTLAPGEQVFAQPLVLDNSVLIVTEANNVYVLDSETGAIKASRNIGTPWNSTASACGDLTPTVGVSGTPVIDATSRTAYFFSKTNRPVQTGIAEIDTVWYAHAVDVDTLAERPNFPVEIAGQASNDPTLTFTPNLEMQRPGLLLMGGVVYAGFGAHCDIGNYNGYIVGVSTAGTITGIFATEAGPQKDHGAGIWQSGGGLVSDGPGRILFMTGNGFSKALTTPIPTNAPPATLDESCVRVNVQPDGTLRAMDFFAPYDAARLDAADADFGAGAPLPLPDSFGTVSHPHLLLAGGKEGILYLLDRDALGGFKQGTGEGDAVVSETNALAGLWSHPAFWSGDGGWAYVTANQSPFQALRYSLRSDGVPVFGVAGSTSDSFGYTSGSPIITSDGTKSGTGLVWVTTTSGGYGAGALRAYDALPDASGALTLRYEDSYGRSSKFAMPGVGAGRIYVGTSDGFVVGYGSPSKTPVSGSAVDFGTVVAGSSVSQSIVLSANQTTTLTAFASTSSAFVLGTPSQGLPATLTLGQTLTVPVTFSPTAPQSYLAALNVTTAEGPSAVSMKGVGITAGPNLQASPTAMSYGGISVGSSSTASITLTNAGNSPVTLTAVTLPTAPFSVVGAPFVGQVLNGGATVAVPITYAPVNSGTFVDHFSVSGGGKDLSVYLSGTSAYQGALTIAPLTLDFGLVPVGSHNSLSFSIADLGGTPITINKSKPPSLGAFSALTTLDEGTVIPTGATVGETIRFSPTQSGAFTDHWVIGSSDAAGTQEVTFTGFASLGTGLLGTYYNGLNFSGPGVKHLDPQIAFSWGGAAPLPGISPAGYSVHWEGQIQAIHDETYTFYARSNQGVRLSIGQSQIINNWTDHGLTEDFGQIALQAGQKYPIVLEFYQHDQQAAIELDWSSPSTPRQIVPSVALFPALDPATGSCQFVALSRVAATASSDEGGLLESSAIDGDLTTRWGSAFSDPQWLSIDLGSVQRVRRVLLSWQEAASKDYDIQVANAPGGPWTTIYTQPNGAGGVEDIQILNANGRYVRLYSRARTTPYGVSLYEMQIYGDPSSTCGPGPGCGNGVLDPGEQCDDGNTINNDACSNSCLLPSCTDGVQNQAETGVDCGGPCIACAAPSCTDHLQNQGEAGVDCGGPCPACVQATCSDGLQNQGESGVDCGGPCPACIQATCSDQLKNQGETGVDCGGPCPACPTCTDGVQNQAETGIDCGGPCPACGASCQSIALTRASAVASTNEAALLPANAIDGSLTTRWGSAFADPQWIYVDLGTVQRVRRVVLRWEQAASKDYDIQVATSASGPWTTIFTQPNGTGGVNDITGLNANGRYVRVYSRSRTTTYGISLFEFEIYGDSNSACGASPACGNGVVDSGEQCDDGNSVNTDTCSNACIRATCSDSVQNESETGVDCGGPCAACVAAPTCTDHIQNQGETGVDCGGPCAACVAAPTCTDHIQNQGETGVDCGGPCAACAIAPTCTDGIQNQGETGTDCGGPCSSCGLSCQSVGLSRASATASSSQAGLTPALAIDGSLTTRWGSDFSDPQWIYVDLGSIERVRRVVLRWEQAASKNYDIQVATSASGPWTTIFTKSNGVGGVDDITGLNANGRYVRVYSRSRTTTYGISLFEFEIYGDSNIACTP